MSVSIILLPAAIAAIAAAMGAGGAGIVGAGIVARKGGPSTLQVATRMKDLALLQDALRDIGAASTQATESEVKATIGDLSLTMTRNAEGIWEAHFESLSGAVVEEQNVAGLLTHLDRAYAARVQSAVAEKIRMRADSAGLDLVSETVDDDQTVTMVLNVRQGG